MRLSGALLAFAVFVMSQPAFALSCMAPDLARDYAHAAQSDDTYILVRGQLYFDEAALPDRTDERTSRGRVSFDIEGWLAGHSLTDEGFSKPFERDVILRVSCLGPWCGGTAKGEHLAFLRQEDRQWVMELNPCPGMTYAHPSAEQEATALACFRGEDCQVE